MRSDKIALRLSHTLVGLAVGGLIATGSALAQEATRGEDRDLQHEQMQGSEAAPVVEQPGVTDAVEKQHEAMTGSEAAPVVEQPGKVEEVEQGHEEKTN